MHYQCKNFGIRELIYPELYFRLAQEGKLAKAWNIFDKELLLTADLIREFIGSPITINSYKNDYPTAKTGAVASGLRPMHSVVGADISMHKFGKALDLKFDNNKWTPEKLRLHMEEIGCFKENFRIRILPFNITDILIGIRELDKEDSMIDFINSITNIQKRIIPFMFLTAVEWLYKGEAKEMKWFHMDTRNSIENSIQIIHG